MPVQGDVRPLERISTRRVSGLCVFFEATSAGCRHRYSLLQRVLLDQIYLGSRYFPYWVRYTASAASLVPTMVRCQCVCGTFLILLVVVRSDDSVAARMYTRFDQSYHRFPKLDTVQDSALRHFTSPHFISSNRGGSQGADSKWVARGLAVLSTSLQSQYRS